MGRGLKRRPTEELAERQGQVAWHWLRVLGVKGHWVNAKLALCSVQLHLQQLLACHAHTQGPRGLRDHSESFARVRLQERLLNAVDLRLF